MIVEASVSGRVYCDRCGQVVTKPDTPTRWVEIQKLIRAHQRSEVCS